MKGLEGGGGLHTGLSLSQLPLQGVRMKSQGLCPMDLHIPGWGTLGNPPAVLGSHQPRFFLQMEFFISFKKNSCYPVGDVTWCLVQQDLGVGLFYPCIDTEGQAVPVSSPGLPWTLLSRPSWCCLVPPQGFLWLLPAAGRGSGSAQIPYWLHHDHPAAAGKGVGWGGHPVE